MLVPKPELGNEGAKGDAHRGELVRPYGGYQT
jgi:hypothetical protein